MVFDIHQHVGALSVYEEPKSADHANGFRRNDARQELDQALDHDRSVRLQNMDEIGIDKAMLMPSNGYLRPDGIQDTRKENDRLVRYQRLAPDRFPLCAGVVEPLHGARGLDELVRLREELGMIGVAYHPRFQGVSIEHPWISRHLDAMTELQLIPFVHIYSDSNLESPLLLLQLARAHPDTPIVALDAFGSYQHTLECFHLAEEADNVFFDTAMAFNWSALETFCHRHGAHRLLFGSDIYSPPIRFRTANTPEVLRGMDVNANDAELILEGNFTALLARIGRAADAHP